MGARERRRYVGLRERGEALEAVEGRLRKRAALVVGAGVRRMKVLVGLGVLMRAGVGEVAEGRWRMEGVGRRDLLRAGGEVALAHLRRRSLGMWSRVLEGAVGRRLWLVAEEERRGRLRREAARQICARLVLLLPAVFLVVLEVEVGPAWIVMLLLRGLAPLEGHWRICLRRRAEAVL